MFQMILKYQFMDVCCYLNVLNRIDAYKSPMEMKHGVEIACNQSIMLNLIYTILLNLYKLQNYRQTTNKTVLKSS
jgi:hypothetical protein